MNRTLKITGIALLLCFGLTPSLKGATDPNHIPTDAERAATASAGREATDTADTAIYDKLKDVLTKVEADVTWNVVGTAVDEEGNPIPKKIVLSNKKVKEIATTIDDLKKYREQLKACGGKDKADQVGAFLDEYVKSLFDAVGADPAHAKDLSENTIDVYTKQIRRFLEEKTKHFDANKADFDKADKKVIDELNSLADSLWENGKREEKDIKEDDKLTIAVTKRMDDVVKGMDAVAADEKVCKLNPDPTAPADNNVSDADKKAKEEADKKAADDKAKQEAANKLKPGPIGGGNPPVDPGVQNPPQNPQNPQTPQPPGGFDSQQFLNQLLDRLGQNGGLQQNQAKDALDRAREAADELDRQRRDQDGLQQALLDQNKNANDALGQALGALGQIQPPSNKSNEKSNTEGSPSISPSLDSGKGGGSQIPPPPPPQQPQPAPQFPYNMLQPPPTPTLAGLTGPSKPIIDDAAPRKSPVVVQDPQTAGLLELLKLQTQLLAASRQQGQGYGGPNVNSIGNRLAGFSGGGAMGARTAPPRRVGMSRINGSATSGAQSRLNVNMQARTNLPSRLRR